METIFIVYYVITGVVGFIVGMLIERVVLLYRDRKLIDKNEIKKT